MYPLITFFFSNFYIELYDYLVHVRVRGLCQYHLYVVQNVQPLFILVHNKLSPLSHLIAILYCLHCSLLINSKEITIVHFSHLCESLNLTILSVTSFLYHSTFLSFSHFPHFSCMFYIILKILKWQLNFNNILSISSKLNKNYPLIQLVVALAKYSWISFTVIVNYRPWARHITLTVPLSYQV